MPDLARTFGFGEPELADNQTLSHKSYTEKLSDSCCGMCLGVFLFWGALATAAWNEYRNVAQQKTLNEAQDVYKEGSCASIIPELEGKLVFVSCPISNLQVLGENDPALQGVPEEQRTGLILESYMEVYQWKEHSSSETKDDKVGGGSTTVTTYTYSRDWYGYGPTSISSFNKQGENCKTDNNGYACLNWDPEVVESWWSTSGYALGTKRIDQSDNVMAGKYVIPSSALYAMGSPEVLTPACNGTSGVECAPGNANLKQKKLTWQQTDSNNNKIDYLDRSYTIFKSDHFSILAQQKGNSFVNWEASYDEDYGLFVFSDGNKTAEQMFEDENAKNVGLIWTLRFLTLLCTIIGLVMITAPLTVVADIIPIAGPFLGDLIGYALWAVDCCFGCCCWAFVVAMTWIFYRPQIGIPLLIVSTLLCAAGSYAVYTQKGKRKGHTAPESGKKVEEEEDDMEVAEEYNPENVEVAGETPTDPDYKPEEDI